MHRRLSLIAALLGVALAVGVLLARAGTPPPAVPVPNHAFPSPSPSPSRAVVWAVGDGADGSARARRLARRIAAGRPRRVLYLGDVYEHGTASDFRRNMRGVYTGLLGRMLPTPGNHEWGNHPTGYDPFWRKVTGARTPPWYAVRLAGWTILSLNSQAAHGPESRQLAWLRRQVRGRGNCRLAFWHRPRYSAGHHGDQEDVAPFWRALRGRARLVLGGHDHDLQRFRAREGLVQIVAGAGGRERHAVDEDDPRLAWSEDDTFGAVRLTLARGRARVDFVSAGGRVLNTSSVRCTPS